MKKRRAAKLNEIRRQRRRAGGGACVCVCAALFHSGTPLVPHSTAEAASQSPFPVCPVTLHHWGQRALRLPVNEPASSWMRPRLFPLDSHSGVKQRPCRRTHLQSPSNSAKVETFQTPSTKKVPEFCGKAGATAPCRFPVPSVVTVHPCNQIMPAEGSGTKTCKF